MSDAESPFEQIRRTSPDGNDYWSGRQLADLLGYTDWRNFRRAVDRARLACANTGIAPADHFVGSNDMIPTGHGAVRKVPDVLLSRYACYLVVQNADPNKEIVALGQSYFAEQTRAAELAEKMSELTDDEKRLYIRQQLAAHNSRLMGTAQRAGVIRAVDFAVFMNEGYKGLYGGLTPRDLHARRGLGPSEHILDRMGSVELGANLFRTTQTEDRLQREQVEDKDTAGRIHHEIGHKIREFIASEGGTMPEDLSTPDRNIKAVQRAEQKRLKSAPPSPPTRRTPSA